MTPKALVIDDDPDILDAVADILESMGHECDLADSVESARKYLDGNQYSYVLLDLEILVRAGRNLPRIQNGENLLEEIIERNGSRRKPIIVMTAHGTDGPDLAVDVMKRGAVDYVTKPFNTVGRTLDKSIREALFVHQDDRSAPPLQPQLDGIPPESTTAPTGTSKRFDGGTMVFYEDRVELCGAIICDNKRKSIRQRRGLDLLRLKVGDRFARYDCEQLADNLGISAGPNGSSGFVRSLRKRIKKALLKQVNIESQDEDVICYDHGYCLSEKLSVQFNPSFQTTTTDITDTDDKSDVRNRDVRDVRNDHVRGSASKMDTRSIVQRRKTEREDYC